MKVIVKSLENDKGHLDTCHVAEKGELDLRGGVGRLRIFGYASKAAFSQGKGHASFRDFSIPFASLAGTCGDFPPETPVFDALWAMIANSLITNENSLYLGGAIEDADKPGA